jgi:hypothetical protein
MTIMRQAPNNLRWPWTQDVSLCGGAHWTTCWASKTTILTIALGESDKGGNRATQRAGTMA